MIVRRHTTFPFSYTPCVIPTTKGIGLEFGILRLAGGESFNDQSGTERLFHLLFGAVSFEWESGKGRAERESLLQQLPSALHTPGRGESERNIAFK